MQLVALDIDGIMIGVRLPSAVVGADASCTRALRSTISYKTVSMKCNGFSQHLSIHSLS